VVTCSHTIALSTNIDARTRPDPSAVALVH
jgi:hypothetical protein